MQQTTPEFLLINHSNLHLTNYALLPLPLSHTHLSLQTVPPHSRINMIPILLRKYASDSPDNRKHAQTHPYIPQPIRVRLHESSDLIAVECLGKVLDELKGLGRVLRGEREEGRDGAESGEEFVVEYCAGCCCACGLFLMLAP